MPGPDPGIQLFDKKWLAEKRWLVENKWLVEKKWLAGSGRPRRARPATTVWTARTDPGIAREPVPSKTL